MGITTPEADTALVQIPLDLESALYDLQPDGATDAAPSPVSPTFPIANTYQLPQGSEWLVSAAKEEPQSPAIDPSTIHAGYSASAGHAVDPFELSNDMGPDPVFGADDFQDMTPMFDAIDSPQYQSASKSRRTGINGAAPTHDYLDTPPSTTSEELRYSTRKRKSLASTSESVVSSPNDFYPVSPVPAARGSPGSPSGPHKKTAHNMIEKRYRNTLNDKINALRDAVPSLRVAARRLEQGVNPDEPMDLDETTLAELGGIEPPQKLNKATILGKAAEYIAYLEKENRRLAKDNHTLRNRRWI